MAEEEGKAHVQFMEALAEEVEGSIPKEEGALYLVEDRLQTFKDANWPFNSGTCTPLKVCKLASCRALNYDTVYFFIAGS